MSRGIERGAIFLDEEDYLDFTARAAQWFKACGTKCLAWALLPNHFHFLLRRGERPLAELMRHVMTGYAVSFNHRHERAGHLFQNRYKALLCGSERYLMALVPYIHLNPLRAGLVQDMRSLAAYPWCGHAAAMSSRPNGILSTDEMLAHYGEDVPRARSAYLAALADGLKENPGALIDEEQREGLRVSDGRILGGSGVVKTLLARTGEFQQRRNKVDVLAAVAARFGFSEEDILQPSHARGPAQARALYSYLCVEGCGVTGIDLRKELRLTQSGISRLLAKGRKLAGALKLVI
jgi:REP element-mobilizing transposase RayT